MTRKTIQHQPRLVTVTEVARHLFCARALGYDRQHPDELNKSLPVQIFDWLKSPWRLGILGVFLVALGLAIGIIPVAISLVVSFWLILIIAILRQRNRFPATLVVYQGTKARLYGKPLVASEFGLVGKPDYLLEKEGFVIPILTKHGAAPDSPHRAHVMQVIAYCLLLSETREQHAPYGVIRYGDGRTFEVDFDEDSVEVLSQLMDEVEADRKMDLLAPRNHQERRRCYACSHCKRCDQTLFI